MITFPAVSLWIVDVLGRFRINYSLYPSSCFVLLGDLKDVEVCEMSSDNLRIAAHCLKLTSSNGQQRSCNWYQYPQPCAFSEYYGSVIVRVCEICRYTIHIVTCLTVFIRNGIRGLSNYMMVWSAMLNSSLDVFVFNVSSVV